MIVNSIIFWFYFTVFLLPYFTLMRGSSKIQNLWLLAASYVFYGYADWRMVLLLVAATIIFFVLSLTLPHREGTSNTISESRRKALVTLGVILGVGMLLYFKYLNFFIEQFAALFALMGVKTNFSSFHILVPIGISFFTFKLIAYVVEVYKGNMEPCKDFVTFASYIAFFPTIMSGPIDSPKMFIPQMAKARRWNYSAVTEGMIRVLWGMFLKMCIADKVSPYTDAVFNNYGHHSGMTIAVASVMYTFQIYTDFSGYSEMAIGTAQIMGFRVTENFIRPYFSTNVGEFWRRWHASLMNWFRDYIYFPLGGSRCSKAKMYRNTMVVFLVSGLWHGANWTFIFWGAYHGLLVCLYKVIKSIKGSEATGSKFKVQGPKLQEAPSNSPKGERILPTDLHRFTQNEESTLIQGSKSQEAPSDSPKGGEDPAHRFTRIYTERSGAECSRFKVQTSYNTLQWERKDEKEQGLKVVDICKKYGSILLVFILVTIGWMVFRCDSFGQFWGMLAGLATPGHFFASWALTAVLPIGIILIKELKDEEGWNIHFLHSKNWVVKAVSVGLLIVFILYMGELDGAKFIYFQF